MNNPIPICENCGYVHTVSAGCHSITKNKDFQMNTNPQNLTPQQIEISNGWRLLTPEEYAILTDSDPLNREAAKALCAVLKPQTYSDSLCRWVDTFTASPAFAFTYRTLAPIPQLEEAIPPVEISDYAAADFVESWNYIAKEHHSLMRSKGFWRAEFALLDLLENANRTDLIPALLSAFDGQKIALLTSEASEALEGLRHGNLPDDKIPKFSAAEAEFADIILRMMDHAHARGWNVAGALVEKFKMNATRANMHGKQF